MSVDHFKPHFFVLPEDDANSDLATGFWLDLDPQRNRQMQILRVAKGWKKVLSLFDSDHVRGMDRYPLRYMILLIDLDSHEQRLQDAKLAIPERLADRVFVLSTLSEPENLKGPKLGYNLEDIGSIMAQDCRQNTDRIWAHDLLKHNESELDRLREHIESIFF